VSEIKKIKHPAFKGVDINSGFEILPALKNINKIKEFKNNLV
jgi:phosphoribosylanthranilate isomerase